MESEKSNLPRILVFSSLFPSPAQPLAGIFIKERMFRVGQRFPITVVAPVPWFPLQQIVRFIKPNYRPIAPGFEIQDSVEIYRPRFLAIPGLFRSFDGLSMALFSYRLVKRLKSKYSLNIIDAHFAYPDGYAAGLLGRWLKLPVSITLRGTEIPQSKTNRKTKILQALENATQIFSVADFIKQHVVTLGADANKILVVGNGIDTHKFLPMNKKKAREILGISESAQILVSVGGLVERKGFHRVIECLPDLRKKYPNLLLLIAGGASAEGDWGSKLHALVKDLGVTENVKFLGAMLPQELVVPLSSADIFVLATRNEGWANVFLEAMACGLPVVTTQVGGNPEVIKSDDLGLLVPFGNKTALMHAIDSALAKKWDNSRIISYARENSWDKRVDTLDIEFKKMLK